MKESILSYIEEWDNVAFGELGLAVPGFSGDQTMFHPDFPNLVLWRRVSGEGIAALLELLKAGKIHLCAVEPLVGCADGDPGPLHQLPTTDKFGPGPYREMTWVPVVFSTQPADPAPVRNKRPKQRRN
ncbi:hypothetical protein SAMN02949497_3538 [Methylomagnum ishizawai]|uniref:Uncharacterized protein n=1 Tax=Methylomagnum ishizawai TaxID=1760988 RepID=A0A1Y6D5M2_9GAMM|nr:hypothetical protein [Methylomagnum ishizawai]SMF96153.1 hypothetical protein SAMN02949497_3538 [Methylomagnum ishizawai]